MRIAEDYSMQACTNRIIKHSGLFILYYQLYTVWNGYGNMIQISTCLHGAHNQKHEESQNITVVAHIMFSAIVACNKISVCITIMLTLTKYQQLNGI